MEYTTHENTLALSGALDVRCTAELRVALYALLGTRRGDVVVDIDRVETIDLTTLKLLAVANRFAERAGPAGGAARRHARPYGACCTSRTCAG